MNPAAKGFISPISICIPLIHRGYGVGPEAKSMGIEAKFTWL
jgi:hypothetical protein